MNKATARPWTMQHDPHFDRMLITGNPQYPYILGHFAGWASDGVTTEEEDTANAALIVHAVNAHDALVNAVKLALRLSQAEIEQYHADGFDDQSAQMQAERANLNVFKAALVGCGGRHSGGKAAADKRKRAADLRAQAAGVAAYCGENPQMVD